MARKAEEGSEARPPLTGPAGGSRNGWLAPGPVEEHLGSMTNRTRANPALKLGVQLDGGACTI